MPFASASVPIHILRGAVGLLALAGAVILGGPALLLLVVTVVAWRGCPTCWAVGLMQTRECRRERCRVGVSRGEAQSH